MKTMIDVLICEDNFASDICKAMTSALWAALHISPAHAHCGISEIYQQLQYAAEKLINTIFACCPKKGKFTTGQLCAGKAIELICPQVVLFGCSELFSNLFESAYLILGIILEIESVLADPLVITVI